MKTICIACIIIFFLSVSCNLAIKNNEEKFTASLLNSNKNKEHIRFDFYAKRMDRLYEAIEVHASLYNDGADTVCFLSSSCEGEQYLLQYDTAVFRLTPLLNCNASFPLVFKIAPKEQYDFSARFRCSNSVQKIKLGFDLYSVGKMFDINTVSLSDIHSRPERQQQVVWANEKMIK